MVDIPEPLLEALLKFRKKSESEWVFVNSRGEYWSDCSSITKGYFKPLLEKIGVKYKSFYSIRHSHATLSLIGGQSLAYLSKQLGHEKISTTTDYYIKYIKEVGGAKKTEDIFKLK
jgi:integrase